MRLPRRRRALAVLLLAPVAVALGGCSLLDGLTGGTLPPGQEDVFTIAVGDCLNDGELGDTAATVPKVDCDEPHDSEVYARTEVTGTLFPGAEVLEAQLTEYCRGDAFTDFVGIAYADSHYDTRGYYPTQQSWANGDRELLCVIWDVDGPVTGSLAGVGK